MGEMSDALGGHILIVTVGQTPAPILAAVLEHAPDGVIFIASQGSHAVAAQVAVAVDELPRHTLLLDDAESLAESYQKTIGALEKALLWEARAITADITGGTKPMVAGATLALSGRGVTFSYVGGARRDAQGRVMDGAETVRVLEDPTALYYLEEWRNFTQAWNGRRLAEAGAHLRRIVQRPLRRSEQGFYAHLGAITESMRAWDLFHHRRAHDGLAAHLAAALAIAEAWREGGKVRVLSELEAQAGRLADLLGQEGKPSRLLLADLLANAERRAETGSYDDALARLYRALELAAEMDLCERHGLILSDPATWPTDVRRKLGARAGGALGLKESLALAFDVDKALGVTGSLAQRLYGDYGSRLRPLLNKRHESILAHGVRPVEREDYEALRDYLAEHGLSPGERWPRW
jgi:CRISPR-associated protein (TIGR02710 family)